MNPCTSISTSSDTQIEVQFSNQRIQFCKGSKTESNQDSVPLLLQPSYARSKSLILDELRNFRISLKWCALDHSTCVGKFISYFTFVFLTIIVPIISTISVKLPASSSSSKESISFNLLVQIPESGLAAIAIFTIFRFFRKYGLRQLLFLDGLQEDTLFVRRGYTRELDKAFRYLACILLPSLFVELAHKIAFFWTVKISLPYISSGVPLNSIMFALVLASWVYRTGVFLLVCVLFRLTCELQILRFEGLYKMFEGFETDAGLIFREHVRIKKQLSATSHRYRLFIIACAFVISVSQLGGLLLVLASKLEKNFLNSGDVVVCSAVELSGFLLCLVGAAKITHRAQGIAAVASRWHMIVTYAASACTAAGAEQLNVKAQIPQTDDDGSQSYECDTNSDSDSSHIFNTPSSQHPSLFQTRQALVAYLEHNCGGITLFGFKLDRGLLHTLFAFEFSLVLWILSKVVVLS